MMHKTEKNEIDSKDILILMALYQKPWSSVRELADLVLLKSVSPVHNRLRFMEGMGLIAPPPSSMMHRSRTITDKGIVLLKELKLIQNAN